MSRRGPTLTVGAAPHWRQHTSITRMNLIWLLALGPTALLGAVFHAYGRPVGVDLDGAYGPVNTVVRVLTVEMGLDSSVLWLFGVLGTVALGAAYGVLAEYLTQILLRQPYRATDGHGALIGLLLALMMPPAVPWWVLGVGVFSGVFFGKQVYGGLGGYPMHPALVGWLVLLLSWPQQVYAVDMASIATPHPAVIVATAVGGLLLWTSGYIRLRIPLATLAGVLVFAAIFSMVPAEEGAPEKLPFYMELFSGHVVLCAFFLATDTTCSPSNAKAQWLFGLGIGGLTMLIRSFGIWPDAIPFAVLLMNILNPLLDRMVPPVRRVIPTAEEA